MDSRSMSGRTERVVLVLQGGGALGAYQAGAYDALCEAGQTPDWVAGISIGAINAAIIAGNRPDDRHVRLRTFWERVSSQLQGSPLIDGTQSRVWKQAANRMPIAEAVLYALITRDWSPEP